MWSPVGARPAYNNGPGACTPGPVGRNGIESALGRIRRVGRSRGGGGCQTREGAGIELGHAALDGATERVVPAEVVARRCVVRRLVVQVLHDTPAAVAVRGDVGRQARHQALGRARCRSVGHAVRSVDTEAGADLVRVLVGAEEDELPRVLGALVGDRVEDALAAELTLELLAAVLTTVADDDEEDLAGPLRFGGPAETLTDVGDRLADRIVESCHAAGFEHVLGSAPQRLRLVLGLVDVVEVVEGHQALARYRLLLLDELLDAAGHGGGDGRHRPAAVDEEDDLSLVGFRHVRVPSVTGQTILRVVDRVSAALVVPVPPSPAKLSGRLTTTLTGVVDPLIVFVSEFSFAVRADFPHQFTYVVEQVTIGPVPGGGSPM